MGFKSFVNSHTGRKVLALLGLIGLALAVCAYILFSHNSSLFNDESTFEGAFKEGSSSFNAENIKLEVEENPLPGLPSETLSFTDYNGDALFTMRDHALGVVQNEAKNFEQKTILNVKANFENSETGLNATPSYDFSFYGESLTDYKDDEAYEKDLNVFFSLFRSGVAGVNFESKPAVNGGREYAITLTANKSFNDDNIDNTVMLWNDTLNTIDSQVLLGENAIVALTLKDLGRVKLSTTLASSDDVETAQALEKLYWSTLATYGYSTKIDYLKVMDVHFRIERTKEDSTLTITTAPEVKDIENLRSRMNKSALESQEQGERDLFHTIWSFNTYLIAHEEQRPYLTFESSSRNW